MVENLETAAKNGVITVREDTDLELIQSVMDYNANVDKLLAKKAVAGQIVFGFYMLNSLVIVILTGTAHLFREKPVLTPVVLFMFIAVLFWFTVKKDLFLCSLAVALLMILDIRFAFLIVFDIVLYIIRRKIYTELKREPGYPAFLKIKIRFEDNY
jgi:hypothetical protein